MGQKLRVTSKNWRNSRIFFAQHKITKILSKNFKIWMKTLKCEIWNESIPKIYYSDFIQISFNLRYTHSKLSPSIWNQVYRHWRAIDFSNRSLTNKHNDIQKKENFLLLIYFYIIITVFNHMFVTNLLNFYYYYYYFSVEFCYRRVPFSHALDSTNNIYLYWL